VNNKYKEQPDKHSILLADDHAIFRAGLKVLLELEHDFEVISEVEDGHKAFSAATELQPDLIIMDLSMPNTNGTEAIAKIKKRNPCIKILALTVHKEEEYVRATLKAGANGYTLKDDSHDELIVAIRTTLKGKTYISPTVSNQVINGYLNGTSQLQSKPSWDLLTQREREVMKLIVEGKKNKEIAEYLFLSTKTVEKHRSNLMRKLNMKSAHSLVAYAFENGLVG
jgi:DNA-binding NarL/FixJ family response regulator